MSRQATGESPLQSLDEFLIEQAIAKHGLSTEGKIRVVADLKKPLAAINDNVARSLYVKKLALHRGSRLLIAIKQYHIEHGTWPDTLNAVKSGVPAEALIDPSTGEEFEYENHGQRFSLFAESVNIWPK